MKKRSILSLTMILAAQLLTLSGCGGEKSADKQTEKSSTLSVSLSSLSEEPLFVDWEQDGQPMQLIALKSDDGVRVAYNTCQSCAGSPYAYYEYEDGILTCQNCGFTFSLDAVGAVSGGCNPKPVGSFTVEDDTLLIGEEELSSAAADFETWKVFG